MAKRINQYLTVPKGGGNKPIESLRKDFKEDYRPKITLPKPGGTFQAPPTMPPSPFEGPNVNAVWPKVEPTPMIELLPSIRSQFTVPTPITYNPIYEQYKNYTAPQVSMPDKPGALSPLSEDYYTAKKNQFMNELKDAYYGKGGVLSNTAYEESAAGRLGSGVGKRNIMSDVTNPFLGEATKFSLGLEQERAQNVMETEKINAQRMDNYAARKLEAEGFNANQINQTRDWLSKINMADSTNTLNAGIANAEIKQTFENLMATLSSSEAGRLSDFDLKFIEDKMNAYWKALELKDQGIRTGLLEETLAEAIANNTNPPP